MRSFSIDIAGYIYRGTWKPRGSNQIEVSSDYGRHIADLTGRDASAVAREVLAALVQQKRRLLALA